MTFAGKAFIATLFTLILISLGAVDAAFTKQTLWIPSADETALIAGIQKKASPDVLAVAQAQGFALAATNEPSVMRNVLSPSAALNSRVLLINNDRVATITWRTSSDVKAAFTQVKQSLQTAFSPKLQDLIDESQSEPGRPPRDMLEFFDPAVAPERLLFVRVRDRLYEFHITAGKEPDVQRLVDALTE